MVTIDHVICPVDLSTASAGALRHAAAWARWYQVPLRVLYVNTPPQVLADGSGQTIVFPAPPIDEVRREVTHFVTTYLPGEPLPVIDVQEGSADSVILEHLGRWPQALLVMGTHGRTGLKHLLLGSVTERVSHATTNPLLIVPPHDGTQRHKAIELKRLVCAVDFRPSSLAGLRYALSLARQGRQQLDLVTVVDAPRMGDDGSLEEAREQRASMRDAFRAHVPDDVHQWCVVHEEVLRGAPPDALLAYAGDVAADLIVMGTGDHGWFHTLWLGSTTARVARSAACPVLIVPAPRRPAFAAAKPIAREAWDAEFKRVSLAYSGKTTTMAVLRDDLGTQREAAGLPFMGLTADLRNGHDEIEVMLASAGGSHLTHVIPHPREVRLHEDDARQDVELVIVGGDGSTTLLDVGGNAPTM
jgi:nucleotide-binding universal stress UspA family protein